VLLDRSIHTGFVSCGLEPMSFISGSGEIFYGLYLPSEEILAALFNISGNLLENQVRCQVLFFRSRA